MGLIGILLANGEKVLNEYINQELNIGINWIEAAVNNSIDANFTTSFNLVTDDQLQEINNALIDVENFQWNNKIKLSVLFLFVYLKYVMYTKLQTPRPLKILQKVHLNPNPGGIKIVFWGYFSNSLQRVGFQ